MTPERKRKLEQVAAQRQAGFVVVLEDIHDPHNAEAILRTCDAFGVQDVWFVFEREEAFNPRRVGKSSSSSANKWLSFRTFKTGAEAVRELRAQEYALIGSVLAEGSSDPYAADLAFPRVALMVGNEHRGLSEGLLAAADVTLRIPMRGMVESLNVSVAAALLIAEITRQRHATKTDITRSAAETIRLLEDLEKR